VSAGSPSIRNSETSTPPGPTSQIAGALNGRAARRAAAALARIARAPEPFDAGEARARFDAAFEGRFAA